jgi:hypothetical protein
LSASDLLRLAGIVAPLEIGDRTVDIVATEHPVGLQLRAMLPPLDGPVPDVRELLTRIECTSPGDTRVQVEDDRVVAHRLVVDADASRLHDAVYRLAASACAAQTALEGLAEVARAAVAFDTAEPPRPGRSPFVDALLSRYRTVASAQSVWDAPDAAAESTGDLQPGEWCEVLESMPSGWAQVLTEGGTPVWTDGRTLVPITEEQP